MAKRTKEETAYKWKLTHHQKYLRLMLEQSGSDYFNRDIELDELFIKLYDRIYKASHTRLLIDKESLKLVLMRNNVKKFDITHSGVGASKTFRITKLVDKEKQDLLAEASALDNDELLDHLDELNQE
jgi:Fe-S cluster assembly iron-binding protein IscA